MKFTKAVLAALMMTVITGSVQAATTATLTINVTFSQQSCDIQVPSSYNLGFLTQGEIKHHDALNITWTCEGDTPQKTTLTAAIVSGEKASDEKVYLMTDSGRTGAMLSLKEKTTGSSIKLTGSGRGDNFCSDAKKDTGMRTCTLIPVTEVSLDGALGLASARLRFEVAYL
ncbi:F18 fimbrial protein FedE [Escherichia coli]|uniref:F18 fimbrial protein FedE n=1 Tax=Escherichia coli TaxID=562 RepID=UPI002FCAA3B4